MNVMQYCMKKLTKCNLHQRALIIAMLVNKYHATINVPSIKTLNGINGHGNATHRGYLLSNDVQMSLLPLLSYDAKSEVDALVHFQCGWTIFHEEVLGYVQHHWLTCGDV